MAETTTTTEIWLTTATAAAAAAANSNPKDTKWMLQSACSMLATTRTTTAIAWFFGLFRVIMKLKANNVHWPNSWRKLTFKTVEWETIYTILFFTFYFAFVFFFCVFGVHTPIFSHSSRQIASDLAPGPRTAVAINWTALSVAQAKGCCFITTFEAASWISGFAFACRKFVADLSPST